MFQEITIKTNRIRVLNIMNFTKKNFAELAKNYLTSPPHVFKKDRKILKIFTDTELETINNFKALKKQIEWISGRICIKTAASEILHIDPARITISYEKEGAPFIDLFPEISFSISHSGNFAACAINTETKSPVGLDIEKLQPMEYPGISNITDVSFTDKEKETITDSGSLFTIWTIKEAYLKYCRTGFHDTIKNVEYLNNSIMYKNQVVNINHHTQYIDDSHIFSLVF
ncbi:MAG: 4'-phosphopantetheinyl transferase superfamily protein [Spirochaetes bacterium]|nr:4'-phosphopantetheinyl transferase superfamily protein [Spirochaetota bacterium]MBN2770184.1 4'-phosphopantetheinyl transferase superfamily protein [Spirochaetota bacterium]